MFYYQCGKLDVFSLDGILFWSQRIYLLPFFLLVTIQIPYLFCNYVIFN